VNGWKPLPTMSCCACGRPHPMACSRSARVSSRLLSAKGLNFPAAGRSAAAARMETSAHGLTLVHFSAQLEPCLSQENTLHTLNTRLTRDTQPLRAPSIPCEALKLSWKVDRCKPLPAPWRWRGVPRRRRRRAPRRRGLHSSTFQLNLSACHGSGGVRKGLCSGC